MEAPLARFKLLKLVEWLSTGADFFGERPNADAVAVEGPLRMLNWAARSSAGVHLRENEGVLATLGAVGELGKRVLSTVEQPRRMLTASRW